MPASEFELELENDRITGRCECCGNVSRTVSGYAYFRGHPFAAYFVHWTMGHVPDYGANFDFIIGKWSADGGTPADRFAVSLVYRVTENGRGFMVIDATGRSISTSGLAGHVLKREEVVGQPIARDAFALCDAIWLQDARIAELSGGPSEGSVS
jgi:hypothetical protein